VLGRGADALRMAGWGLLTGLPAFAPVLLAGPLQSALLFSLGVFLIGLGGGLFGHGTLTATMRSVSDDRAGLALGAWGAVQASAGGLALALGGVLRDGFNWLTQGSGGYSAVYVLEAALLALSLRLLWPLLRASAAPAPIGHNGQAPGSSPL